MTLVERNVLWLLVHLLSQKSIAVSDQSLYRLLLSGAHATSTSGKNVMRTCPLLTVRLKALSRSLLSSDLKWRFSARSWYAHRSGYARLRGSGLGRQIWNTDEHTRPVWTTQRAVRRRSVSRRTSAAAHTCVGNGCLSYRTQSNGSLKSQRPRGEVKACASQRFRGCDHVDPVDRLEVEPEADQRELWRATCGGSPRQGSACTMGTRCRHARLSSYPRTRTSRRLRPAHPVRATRAEGALLQSSSQTCTARSP